MCGRGGGSDCRSHTYGDSEGLGIILVMISEGPGTHLLRGVCFCVRRVPGEVCDHAVLCVCVCV